MYIGTIPFRKDAPAEQIIGIGPLPKRPVSNAMMAKVGAAARRSQSAAPRLIGLPHPGIFFLSSEREDIAMSAIFVMAAPPGPLLIASLGCAVEPLIHAPKPVQPAPIGGIGVVDDAILEREGAHAGPLAKICRRIGSTHGRVAGG